MCNTVINQQRIAESVLFKQRADSQRYGQLSSSNGTTPAIHGRQVTPSNNCGLTKPTNMPRVPLSFEAGLQQETKPGRRVVDLQKRDCLITSSFWRPWCSRRLSYAMKSFLASKTSVIEGTGLREQAWITNTCIQGIAYRVRWTMKTLPPWNTGGGYDFQ